MEEERYCYEHVDLKPGEAAGFILGEYGIDPKDWNSVLRLPQNSHIPATATWHSGPPVVPFLRVPMDEFVFTFDYRLVSDLKNGLRPLPLNAAPDQRAQLVSQTAHGVDLELTRSGLACMRLRWLQTVKKRNAPAVAGAVPPLEFVDIGGNGLPFYDDPSGPCDTTWDDLPCGPITKTVQAGVDFLATVSLVVWTHPRITIHSGYTYRFQIHPNGPVWVQRPTEATARDYSNQVRILQAGVNQSRENCGPGLTYRTPPARGSINQ